MKKSVWILVTILFLGVLTVINYLVIRNTYSWYICADIEDVSELDVYMDRDDILEIEDIRLVKESAYPDEKLVIVDMRAKSEGTCNITIRKKGSDLINTSIEMYVNSIGIILDKGFNGSLNNISIIRYEIISIFMIMIINILYMMRNLSKKFRYSYRLMFYLGAVVFLAINTIMWICKLIFTDYYTSTMLSTLYNDIVRIFHAFAILVFPGIFLLAIYLIISNIVLMKHEGRRLTNMLGIGLGVMLVVMTLVTFLAYNMLGMIINVHSYAGLHIENSVESIIDILLAYLECMLVGTAIWSRRAARHVPAFDKDYVIILGCSIRDDGSVTPLLKGRADRAIWFAKEQKEKSGKDIMFVASGGQGDDEVISEGEAIKNYLISCGIPENQILVENKSTTTNENFKFSYELIKKHFNDNRNGKQVSEGAEKTEPGIVFSTTEYHVFRGGHIAESLGIRASGIGSRTKWYFHINALIREFVANMNIERKKHILNILTIIFITIMMNVCSYIFNIL